MKGAAWDVRVDKLLPGRQAPQLAALFPRVPPADFQPVLDLLRLARPPQPPVASVTNGTSEPLFGELSAFSRLITWRGVELALPYRVYFPEPPAAQVLRLTSRQQQLLHCVYLRHCDGFVRQRHLEALLRLQPHSPADFAVPFLFSLVGEYVQEILVVLAQHLTPGLLRSYVELINENPLYWQKTQGRVASYWDIYYRRGRRGAPRFQHYVGARLLAALRQARCQAAKSETQTTP